MSDTPFQPSQMESLVSAMTAAMPPRTMQFFDAEMTTGQLVNSTKSLGLGRYRMGVLRYTVSLSWIGFPFREYPPVLIYAHLLAWVYDHRNGLADELELSMPQIDPAFDHELSADLVIDVELADEITIAEDPDGPILFQGKCWSPELPVIHTAKDFSLNVARGGAND